MKNEHRHKMSPNEKIKLGVMQYHCGHKGFYPIGLEEYVTQFDKVLVFPTICLECPWEIGYNVVLTGGNEILMMGGPWELEYAKWENIDSPEIKFVDELGEFYYKDITNMRYLDVMRLGYNDIMRGIFNA